MIRMFLGTCRFFLFLVMLFDTSAAVPRRSLFSQERSVFELWIFASSVECSLNFAYNFHINSAMGAFSLSLSLSLSHSLYLLCPSLSLSLSLSLFLWPSWWTLLYLISWQPKWKCPRSLLPVDQRYSSHVSLVGKYGLIDIFWYLLSISCFG